MNTRQLHRCNAIWAVIICAFLPRNLAEALDALSNPWKTFLKPLAFRTLPTF